MNTIELAMRMFTVLGAEETALANRNFYFYLAPDWPSPSFSPVILKPGRRLSEADLDSVECYFRTYPVTNPSLHSLPYFCFFDDEQYYDHGAIARLCDDHGWSIEPVPLFINLMFQPLALRLPAHHRIEVHNVTTGLPPAYQAVLQTNFGADAAYLQRVADLYRRADASSYTTLIYHEAGVCVGGGTVSVRDGSGFLTWGAISEPYRNKRLHDVLLASCTMIARSYGAEACALTTRNAFIRGKSEAFAKLLICRKSAPAVSGRLAAPGQAHL